MMSTALARKQEGNVVPLRNPIVQEVYQSYIAMHRMKSMRTAEEYDSRIKEFFKLTLKKDIAFIEPEEIIELHKKDVIKDFVMEQSRKGNKNSTIITKLNSVRSFYNELLANNVKVNPKTLDIKLPKGVKHHEALSLEELQSLYDFMKNEKELGEIKYLLFKTMFVTGNRISETLSMTWKENFIVQKDENIGVDVHVVKVLGKGGKWNYKPISDEFYEELQQLNNGQEEVFPISIKTVRRSLARFTKQLGRKITPHSFKATAITLGYKMSKDINLCKQLGSHSSTATTEIYLRDEDSFVNQLSYNMSLDFDDSVLDDMSKEELLDIIKSNEDIKYTILMRMRG